MSEYYPLYQQYAPEGLPPDTLRILAEIESNHNAAAQNPWSSAGGLFQFTDSTAKAYGLTGDSRFDPQRATEAAARLATDNANYLRQKLGREPTIGELYLAHQQGMGGATALLSKPNANVVDALTPLYGSREQAERVVRQNGGKPNQTAGQFATIWTNKADKVQQRIPPGEIPNVVASQTDTQRPGIVGNSERPTSALSAAYPTQNATPRLAPQMDGIYAYNPADMQKAQITPGLGSLTPDFFKPQFTPSRLPPEAAMSFAALDRGPRSRADVPLPQPRPSRSVTGFPTPLPGYQPGPERRLPEISPPPGYNRMDAMAGIPSDAMRQELALQGQSYAGMDRAPSSGIGRPPATRTVPSVPVPATQTAAVDGVGYMPTMGLMRATLGSTPKPSPAPPPTTAIPGPNALPKGGERIAAGLPTDGVPAAAMGYGAVFPALPDMRVGTALDVVPQVIPRVPIGPGLPPAPLPRPLRSGVNVQMPTPMGQRPTLPMPRPVMGFPTSLAQRPIPAPTLRVTVNGANSYSGGSSPSMPTPRQTVRYDADANVFRPVTVYDQPKQKRENPHFNAPARSLI